MTANDPATDRSGSPYDERPWLALYDEGVPADLTIPFSTAVEMFDAALAANPSAACVHYFDSTLTMQDVDRLSAALAVGLQAELGIARGDRVMVQLQNVPGFVLALLALWRLGAIMVPVNPMFKRDEMTKLITDSGSKALVQMESLYEDVGRHVAPPGVPVVTVSELDHVSAWPSDLFPGVERRRHPGTLDLRELMAAHEGQRPPPVDLGPDDVALLVYTSGTTGAPKGAMNTHRGVVFNSENYRVWCKLDPTDVCLGIAPLFHVTGLIAHIGVCLLTPMPLVLGYRFHPVVMAQLVERYRASWVMGSITAYISLLNEPEVDGYDLSSLRKLWSGGQPVSPTTVADLEAKLGAYVHNLYGLTEVTSESHAVPAGRRAPVDPHSGALSVGPPVSGFVVRIVDDEGVEVPVGEIGELVMESPSVVPGYWGKPDETAKAMPGGRLKTGDVGFMDTEGWFYIVDRKKDMIIASGFKIWPRDVEDVLYQHPAVRETAVVGEPDAYRGETVRAFVSLKAGASATSEELVAFCRERLAAYKCPRQVDVLPEIPKTASGKILRRALRQDAG